MKAVVAEKVLLSEVKKKVLDSKIPVIAVGGIASAADAMEKINAGASLVQIYTGFIYSGPKLISDCALVLKNH